MRFSIPFTFLFLICLIQTKITAQIGGISGTKFYSYCVDPIPTGTIEFEPTFSSMRSNSAWQNGELLRDSLTEISSALCWRTTYAATDKLELGVNAPSDMSNVSLSFKRRIVGWDSISFGFMGGLNLPLGNRTYSAQNMSSEDLNQYGVGLISTWQINETNSIDFNIQYLDVFTPSRSDAEASWFVNCDFGTYDLKSDWLVGLAVVYQSQQVSGQTQQLLTLYPGIAFEHSENYVLVLFSNIDIAESNMAKNLGFGLSVTTLWK